MVEFTLNGTKINKKIEEATCNYILYHETNFAFYVQHQPSLHFLGHIEEYYEERNLPEYHPNS
jgi:hypothetical protein